MVNQYHLIPFFMGEQDAENGQHRLRQTDGLAGETAGGFDHTA